MIKLLASLAIATTLSLAPSALAASTAGPFGPNFARFTINAPDGWMPDAIPDGVLVINKEGTSSMSIVVRPAQGKKAEEIAKDFAEALELKDPKVTKQDDNSCTISGRNGDGKAVGGIIYVRGETVMDLSMETDDPAADMPVMQDIFKSVKDYR
ncbi:MAG: hypothetical protein K6E40_10230 [Desulfovibrio sp.]|nr:hypothetical protein [Desulfovibrio sp.]